ncbi:sigma-70 family RNA polymerase sigma factor [Methylobacterium mesophilicum]
MDDRFPATDPSHDEDVVDIHAHVRNHLGNALQSYFALPARTELPQRLAYLVERFDTAAETSKAHPENGFRDTLIGAVPALRGFAFSLAGDATRADDLVQETLVKAWAGRDRFTPGTNFNAWLFTILRNQFYTEMRKAKREVEDSDGSHAARLTALPEQEGVVNLRMLQDRLARIPEAQRIALLMVGAEGYTYEEAAEVLMCRVGTVKSRVSRARAYLSDLLGLGDATTTDAHA